MAVNLLGLVFAREEFNPLSDTVINHEEIHAAQIKEMFCIGFYAWYLLEWLLRISQYWSFKKAYRNISFEREARANQFDFDYLAQRTKYSFLKYILYGL